MSREWKYKSVQRIVIPIGLYIAISLKDSFQTTCFERVILLEHCPQCNSWNERESDFCSRCGHSLKSIQKESNIDIKDSVIQRSQIGQASVGSVHISPSMSQNVYGTPTCPQCKNILSETNILQYCKLCDTTFCNRCPEKYDTPADEKTYEFNYLLTYKIRWTEPLRNDYGEIYRYQEKSKTKTKTTKTEILKRPLCDSCYDKACIDAFTAQRINIRTSKKELEELRKTLTDRQRITISQTCLNGVDSRFEKQIIEELEGCTLCNGSGECQKCEGTTKCINCRGEGNCQNCNGTGDCTICNGRNICRSCSGTGKAIFFRCKTCHGTGRCRCQTGKDHVCNGTGHCKTCGGSGECEVCSGNGKCLECEGTGNLVTSLSENLKKIFSKVRNNKTFSRSLIYAKRIKE